MEVSVKEYASMKQVSVQSVYQAIGKDKLKYVVKDGKKWIVIDPGEIKAIKQSTAKEDEQPIVEKLMKTIERKDKEIKRLTKQLLKCAASKETVLLQYIQELKQLQLPMKKDEVIVKVKKKKKKKR